MCHKVNTGCPYPAIPPCTGAHFEPKEVRPRDLAPMMIDKAKSLPPIPQQALDEFQCVVKQFEVAP